ncbi:type 1 fimbrial major subunit FimA [Enterobacter kobei]|uniref:type 1 fimbrial major subunit FimA n=1 Tax=Enterobacter kobei TaxID=208224 RepID=UPI003CE71B56
MKFNKSILAVVAAMSMTGAVVSAQAETTTVAGGVVHFTGSLVNAACSVSNESADKEVVLGQYRTAQLVDADSMTAQIPFTLVLEDCDPVTAGVTTAAVAFSGQHIDGRPDLLMVGSHTNKQSASNVGIQILDEGGKIAPLDGSTGTTAHTLIKGENTLSFSARYVSLGGATEGDADADATFTMIYE